MDIVAREVAKYRPITMDTPTLLEEIIQGGTNGDDAIQSIIPRSRVLHGGRLISTFTLAEMGELSYNAEVTYRTMSESGDDYRYLDLAVLEHLKEDTRGELDCQVCYALLLDPLTTSCGHTFCRKCLARVLDHSNLCPICRRTLSMPPAINDEPNNNRLSRLLSGLCPEMVAVRVEIAATEDVGAMGELNTPLFVCALAYPSMPTFLHVFEPRYRLMIRRAIETGGRKFGMMMYNRQREPQGSLGITQFMQYGTLVHIVSVEMLQDGRSLVETVGVSRFRVMDWGILDGYTIGSVERVDDVSIVEEEEIEALETSATPAPPYDLLAQLDRFSTGELLEVGTTFIAKMRASSAPWLHERVLAAYGHPPDDPALFPYWFASILPIAEDEKYKLMSTTSVRERLKMTARWVRRIEAQRW
ncbi:MAG: hypothetical protein M1827_005893 [Pycnora praestabilis]|nr:MAG: hypothetical protein M1827_005893 [Pycnora praestabilis]